MASAPGSIAGAFQADPTRAESDLRRCVSVPGPAWQPDARLTFAATSLPRLAILRPDERRVGSAPTGDRRLQRFGPGEERVCR